MNVICCIWTHHIKLTPTHKNNPDSSLFQIDLGQLVLFLSHLKLLLGAGQLQRRMFLCQELLPLSSLHVCFSLQQIIRHHQHTTLWTTSSCNISATKQHLFIESKNVPIPYLQSMLTPRREFMPAEENTKHKSFQNSLISASKTFSLFPNDS